ncbi:MAG TPA: trehalose-phosphatase [Gemmatimonadaceae bacterium]|nr:trehalose-phosphatase [Gemmatimonadaceae bacterium]
MKGPEPLLPLAPTVRARLSGTPLVVMLDVDGTLAPIAARPEEAEVPPETRRAVAALAARDGVHVALVSGRAAGDARRMVAVSNVWVIGNHGAEMVSPSGEEIVDAQVAPFECAMAQARTTLAQLLEPVKGAIVEDKRWTLSVHYRQVDPRIIPRVQGCVDRVATGLGLRVHEGKMVCEVRPPVRVDKGTAVFTLAQRLGGLAEGAGLLFIGDDRTDEDAFRVLRYRAPLAVTVRVAEDPRAETVAEFTVPDPPAVRALLVELSKGELARA